MDVLRELGIVPCDSLTPEHEEQIQAAGYNLDSILDTEGITAEKLHDALFLTSEIARATLGSNYERVSGSIKSCSRIVRQLPPESRIADLGGACGVICFEAARLRPDCSFVVADRSRNALSIGETWAKSLDLHNVVFNWVDFAHHGADVALRRNNELVILEYVFEIAGDWESEDHAIGEFFPALRTASQILSANGSVQVRFGEFSETGLVALVRAAYRTQLSTSSISVERDGCTFVFVRQSCANRPEDSEVSSAMAAFAAEMWS